MPMRLTIVAVVLFTPLIALAQNEDSSTDAEASVEPDTPETPAEEAPDPGIEPSDEEARALFTAGRLAFEQGELERALEHFVRAYELSERPTLLFNIGNAHDRLRHDEQAVDYLSRYLDAVPDAPNADFVRSRIEVLRANIAERQQAEEAVAAERARLLAAANTVDATASDAGIALMIGGGAGLLVSIAPIVWYVSSTSSLNHCRVGTCTVSEARSIAGQQDAALALTVTMLVTSVLAGGAGVVLFAVAPRPHATESPSVACVLAPNGVGCSGTF